VVVVHERNQRNARDRHFGPYLGGRQVRLAVSGLCRVLPLSYASKDLAGTRQDMARVRGVDAADRATLADAAAKVLNRDPKAVTSLRKSLIERRDAASGILAFELAARLQQEIEALDWVTAGQKVTGQDPADYDVCGWSQGVLICFAIRTGRLTGWTQRACGQAAARRHLERTPPDWAPFAQRNAELAARLTGG
jgi:excinuclease ABC subunit C